MLEKNTVRYSVCTRIAWIKFQCAPLFQIYRCHLVEGMFLESGMRRPTGVLRTIVESSFINALKLCADLQSSNMRVLVLLST